MSRVGLRWPLLAAIGLVVAIAIALVATRMVSERIGISSQPTTSGGGLAPHTRSEPADAERGDD